MFRYNTHSAYAQQIAHSVTTLRHGITRLAADLHRTAGSHPSRLLGVRRPDAQRSQPTQEKGPSAPTTQVQWGDPQLNETHGQLGGNRLRRG